MLLGCCSRAGEKGAGGVWGVSEKCLVFSHSVRVLSRILLSVGWEYAEFLEPLPFSGLVLYNLYPEIPFS